MSQTYRAFGHTFTLEAASGEVESAARRLLAPFAAAASDERLAAYRIERRPGRDGYWLYYDDALIVRGGAGDYLIAHLLWHINAEAARRTDDVLLIHAGAVVSPGGRGVVLPAASGSGKTTLVAGLVRAGFGYLSDEAAALDPATGRVLPHPKALAFKRDPRELLGLTDVAAPLVQQWHVLPSDLRDGAVAPASPVGHVVVVSYEPGAPTDLAPLSRAAAAVELGGNALNLPAFGARCLPLLAGVLRDAACWRLRSGDLAVAVTAVSRACAAAEAGQIAPVL